MTKTQIKELEKSINEILEDSEEKGLIVASGTQGLFMGEDIKIVTTLSNIILRYLENNKKDLSKKAETLKKFIDFVVEAKCDTDKLEELLIKDTLKQAKEIINFSEQENEAKQENEIKDIFEELFKIIK